MTSNKFYYNFIHVIFFIVYFLFILTIADYYMTMLAGIAFIFIVNWIVKDIIKIIISSRTKTIYVTTTFFMFLVFQVWQIYGVSTLKNALTIAQNQNVGITIYDVEKSVQDKKNENGGLLLLAAGDIVGKRIFVWKPNEKTRWIHHFRANVEDLISDEDLEQRLQELENLMDKTQDITTLMEKAFEYPNLYVGGDILHGTSIGHHLMPHLPKMTNLVNLCQLRSYYFLKKKNFSRLQTEITRLFSLAKILRQEHFIISQLVANSIQNKALNFCYVLFLECKDKKILTKIQQEIESVCAYQKMDISTEIILYNDTAKQIQNSPAEFMKGKTIAYILDIPDFKTLFDVIPLGLVISEIAYIIQKSTISIKKLQQNEHDVHDYFFSNAYIRPKFMQSTMTFDFSEIAKREFTLLAYARCLWIAIELRLQEYLPSKNILDVDKYGQKCIDPFTQKPLILKMHNDSFILYSMGVDMQDDNGSCGKYFQKNSKDLGVFFDKTVIK